MRRMMAGGGVSLTPGEVCRYMFTEEYEASDPEDEGVAHVSLRSPHHGFPSGRGWGLHRGCTSGLSSCETIT